MRSFFRNDYFFENIYQITPEFLKGISIFAIVADLDNTLADYDTPVPTEEIVEWINSVVDAGIAIAIVSNNKKERVEKFCEKLNVPYYWKSGKPRKKTILSALENLGASRENAAMLGDKFTTDVLGARASGIRMIQVRSIKPWWKRRNNK